MKTFNYIFCYFLFASKVFGAASTELVAGKMDVKILSGRVFFDELNGSAGALSNYGFSTSIGVGAGAIQLAFLRHTELYDKGYTYDFAYKYFFPYIDALPYVTAGMHSSNFTLKPDGEDDPETTVNDSGSYSGLNYGLGIEYVVENKIPLAFEFKFYRNPGLWLGIHLSAGYRF